MITRIITSGAYVGSELQAEFGRLPPSFLPIGGSLLVTHQVEMLRGDDIALILTIPDSFAADESLLDGLASAGVKILRLPPDISLGESVALALALAEMSGTIDIVHGDTLIAPPSNAVGDGFTVAPVTDGYAWSHVTISEDRVTGIGTEGPGAFQGVPIALTGFFRFSDASALLRALVRRRHRFVEALDDYCKGSAVLALPSMKWLDLGHLQTYFRSRHALASSRHFNSLRIADGLVHKSSEDSFKIEAEARWLSGLPPQLSIYGARMVSHGKSMGRPSYATEYAFLPTLAEISLSHLGIAGWKPIVTGIDQYLTRVRALPAPEDPQALFDLAITKLHDRVAAHPEAFPDFDRPLRINGRSMVSGRDMVQRLEQEIRASSPVPTGVMHGDLCFSNIFYSSRTTRISLIDPRGYVRMGEAAMGGDLRYDLAKLAHSAIGGYDRIVAGHYSYARDGDAIEFAVAGSDAPYVDLFRQSEFAGMRLSSPDIAATMISLFISMMPLHSDRPERQQAFYANALRLYGEYFGEDA